MMEPATCAAPLSWAQRRLWLLDGLGAGSAAHVSVALRLRGPLQPEPLERAIRGVIARHDILRSRVFLRDGSLVQVVGDELCFRLERADLSDHPDREAGLLELAGAHASAPFRLERGPLLRCRLVRTAEDDHVLLLCAHHLAWDGWSTKVFLQEVSALYEGEVMGRSVPLPALRMQYADYARAQKEQLATGALEHQIEYWRDRLSGLTPLELIGDRPRPTSATSPAAEARFELPPELAGQLRELARRERVTGAALYLGAWALLLSRLSSSEDVAVGVPVSARAGSDVESLIGVFINVLTLRLDLSGDPSFVDDVLPAARDALLGGMESSAVPYEKLVEELRGAEPVDPRTFFSVLFSMEYVPVAGLRLGTDVEVEPLSLLTTRTSLDLDLRVMDTGEHVAGRLIYNTDLFDEETANSIADLLRAQLERIARAPRSRASELAAQPLPAAEPSKSRPAAVGERRHLSGQSFESLQRRLERRVLAAPDAVALRCGGNAWTARGLDVEASNLASRLRARGVGRGFLVGILLERGAAELVALVGVLKSGAALVPLDRTATDDRLETVVRELEINLLVTERLFERRLVNVLVERLAFDDQDAPGTGDGSRVELPAGQAADILYALPAGRGVEAGGGRVDVAQAALIARTRPQLESAAGEVACLVDELWSPGVLDDVYRALLSGGTLVWPEGVGESVSTLVERASGMAADAQRPAHVALDAQELLELLEEMEGRSAQLPRPLRFTVRSAERCTQDEARSLESLSTRIRQTAPRSTVCHVFALPELAGDVFDWELSSGGELRGRTRMPFSCRILDRWGQVLPAGIPGELAVLRADDAGAVRTGDVARQHKDGTIEIVRWRELEEACSEMREALSTRERLELPCDRPRSVDAAAEIAVRPLTIDDSLAAELRAVSARADRSLQALLLRAWQLLLSRYTDLDDILVGVSIPRGDPRREAFTRSGVYAPSRLLVTGDSTFHELLSGNPASPMATFPFERLLDRLERSDREEPFQVLFEYRRSRPAGRLADESARALKEGAGDGFRYELAIRFLEHEDGLSARVHFRPALLDGESAARLGQHFLTLARGIAERPDAPVAELPLLDADVERLALREWNDTRAPYPEDSSLTDLFHEQVERTPSAVAVEEDGAELTYHELQLRVRRLAAALRERGVARGDLVGVCLERSIAMVVSVLATLEAGAAYVPLDPRYPRARLELILRDADPRLVLTKEGLWSQVFGAGESARVLDVESLREAESTASNDALGEVERAGPDDIAYVLYTSGSTGTPKGVVGHHRGVVNRVAWQWRVYPWGENEVAAGITTLNFVDSVWELFGALLAGVRLLLLPDMVVKDHAAFLEAVAARDVRRIVLIPSLLRVLLEAAPDIARRWPSVELFGTSGEPIPGDLVRLFFELLPGRRLVNLYGASEVASDAATCELDAQPGPFGAALGRPISNVRCYVLDHGLRPVPIGVRGELYVGGAGVARGYLRRPELTAERFVRDPFQVDGGEARLYRTGDICRWRRDGVLELIGRADHQVKVRGFRVELGELEAVLSAHPGVDAAVAAAWEDSSGDRRLVAYVIPGSPAVTEEALRSFAAERLPDYMTPSRVMLLDAFPLLPNGKLDRARLPEPEARGAARFVAPRSGTEELLCALWSDMLGIENVGIHENFFAAGGHSLLATRLMSRLRVMTGRELPLHELFDHPTVATFAERLQVAGREAQGAPLVAVERPPNPPLTFAQARLWFLDRAGSASGYGITGALRLDGNLDSDALERALREVVARHESLRTRFVLVNGVPAQRVDETLDLRIERIDLRGSSEAAREDELREQVVDLADRPFDLELGPLLRAALIRLNETSSVFAFTLHHIVTDAWSNNILMRELSTLYSAELQRGDRAGEPEGLKALPDLPLQVPDYALWQRRALQGEKEGCTSAVGIERLCERLRHVEVLELTTDRKRPARQGFRCAQADFALGEEATVRLRALCRDADVTLAMLLLAAWQVLLARASRSTGFAVGMPVAGRSHPALEPLIGTFVNAVVVPAELEGDPRFRDDFLPRVRAAALEAYEYQDVPFEALVEALNPPRDPSRHPVYQAVFALQNVPREDVSLEGLEVTPLHFPTSRTGVDVDLRITEREGALACRLTYDADLFTPETSQRLCSSYRTLLKSIPDSPNARISSLPLLTTIERAEHAERSRGKPLAFPHEACLHHLVEDQTERTPDATALFDTGTSVTYGELNAQANRVAAALREAGVTRGDRVALFQERSTNEIVALIGILKAGAAYVPLDVDAPRDWNAHVLALTEPRLVLSSHAQLDALPAKRPRTLVLENAPLDAASIDDGNPPRESGDQHELYVLCTSGSTGTPKGVVGLHRSYVNRLFWQLREVPWRDGDVACHKTSLGFVDSVAEVFAPLASGIPLFVVPPGLERDPRAFVRAIGAAEVTRVVLVPSLLRAILNNVPDLANAAPRARTWLAGGEELTTELVTRFHATVPNAALWNIYGATETASDVCVHETRADPAVVAERARIPIGKVLPGAQVYVLDTAHALVPDGLPGELFAGGECLGPGYVGQEARPTEAYVRDPFSADPEAVLYRLGDLGRRLPSGELEYLGRVDHQVKIRGHRVELGGVEAVLREHPQVRDCCVLVESDVASSTRLVAFAASKPNALHSSELLTWLTSRLPAQMVPARVVLLDELPLTPSGKVDRLALAALPPGEEAVPADAAPRNELEELLAGVWCRVLRLDSVGIHDDFFDLGGHSLLALELLEQVHDVFGQRLELNELLDAPTLAQQGHRLARNVGASRSSALVKIQPHGTRPPVFCVCSIGGTVLNQRPLATRLGPDQPFFGLQAVDLGDDARIEDYAAHYVEVLESVYPSGPCLVGGHSFGALVAFEMAQQLCAKGREVALVFVLDSACPAEAPAGLTERLHGIGAYLRGLASLPREAAARAVRDPKQLGRDALRSVRWNGKLAAARLRGASRVADVRGSVGPRDFIDMSRWPELNQRVAERHYRAMLRYRPLDYAGRLTLFRSRRPPLQFRRGPKMGWDAKVLGELQIRTVPGGHLRMMDPPHVDVLAEELARCIASATASRSGEVPARAAASPGTGGERRGSVDHVDR